MQPHEPERLRQRFLRQQQESLDELCRHERLDERLEELRRQLCTPAVSPDERCPH